MDLIRYIALTLRMRDGERTCQVSNSTRYAIVGNNTVKNLNRKKLSLFAVHDEYSGAIEETAEEIVIGEKRNGEGNKKCSRTAPYKVLVILYRSLDSSVIERVSSIWVCVF